MTTKEPKNTDKDWGAPEKLPLKRRLRRWAAILAAVIALVLVLDFVFAIPLVRHYLFIGHIIYDGSVGQVVREATLDKNRDLTLPNSPYKTYKSGYWIHNVTSNGIYWINNDTIVFNTNFKQGMDRPRIDIDIAIWNYRSQPKIYRKAASLICADSNGISFYDRETQSYLYQGNNHDVIAFIPAQTTLDIIECPQVARQELNSNTPIGAYRELRSGDGWLEFRKHDINDSQPNIFWHKNDNQIVEISLSDIFITHDLRIKYYPFKDAYLLITGLTPDNKMWSATQDRLIWWLNLSGEIEKIIIPAPWGIFRNYYPTKLGIVFSGSYSKSEKESHEVFILKSNRIQSLMATDVSANAISVSPNGCSIAFAATDVKNSWYGKEVYVIDLCSAANGEKDAR